MQGVQLNIFNFLDCGFYKNEEEIFIDFMLKKGSGTAGDKYRIYHFFNEKHDKKDLITFVKNEYNYYGCHGGDYSLDSIPSKGLELSNCSDMHVTLPWAKVAMLIKELVDNDSYLTKEEKNIYKTMEDPLPLWYRKHLLNTDELEEL